MQFSDVAFFRLGFFDYAKLNTENMLMKYEAGVWYAVDLLMDWNEQRVSIYINGDEYKSTTFFTQSKDKLTSANAVSIYGLSPGSISKFKDIRICNEVCSAEAAQDLKDLSGAFLGYGYALATLSALYLTLLA